jgi:Zn-dependent peptidase ImmA (M78 family)/DNA-binding XRE family transcriptional regulator
MTRSAEALVKATLLAWGRKTARLDERAAAKRIGVSVDVLQAWERGETRPSFVQLRKLAEVYKRPVAVFYLPEPPTSFDAMRYFRQLPDAPPPETSPELTFQLREAESRRDVALDLAGQIDIEVKPFPLKATLHDTPEVIAERVRAYLGTTVEEQSQWRDQADAFRKWRDALEAVHVLVFQMSKVSVDEARGFSIAADTFPVIAVNGRDSYAGKTFSLFHELGHLLLRQGELWDPSAASPLAQNKDQVEVFCNEFAGVFLVPSRALNAATRVPAGARRDSFSEDESKGLAQEFSVSEEVILRRLLSTRRITERFYQARRTALIARAAKLAEKPKSKAIVPPFRKVIAQLGRSYIRTVLGAYYQERITLSAVSDYLGVKIRHLPQIEAHVFAEERAG